MAADLVRRQVAVIVATGGTRCGAGGEGGDRDDPDRLPSARSGQAGLVASLARPGGNLTGINFFSAEWAAKRLELLRELVPAAARVAVLFNPTNAKPSHVARVEAAARAIGTANPGLQRQHQPRDRRGFRDFARERPGALFVSPDPSSTAGACN